MKPAHDWKAELMRLKAGERPKHQERVSEFPPAMELSKQGQSYLPLDPKLAQAYLDRLGKRRLR
jgi:hypothetical protein